MSSPGDPITPRLPAEDAFLELLIETLDSLDRPARSQFVQRYLKSVAQLDLSETQSLEYWEQILARRKELSDSLGKPISLKTAMVDVLASADCLRVPVLMEYEDLKKLQINAATDPLTGLYNRRLFEEYFEKELNRARRYSHSVVLVIMDLHRFKEVNDRYGHPRGDQVLQSAAETLRKSLRTSDYAFRIGGDEFALLLPQSDFEQAATLCRRVRANFQTAIQPMRLGISVALDYGMAAYPQDGDQKEVLMRIADEQLYKQKEANRTEQPEAPQPLPPPPPSPWLPPLAPPPAVPGEKPEVKEEAAPPPPLRRPATERRKWERVILAGTRAYAQIGAAAEKTARVLDLGYGGVALEMTAPEELVESFQAILHVPILPPVRVSLRRVYVLRGVGPTVRVGCAFLA